MNYQLTEHAKKRMRQRSFSDYVMNIVLQYGRHEPATGGAIKIILGNKNYQALVTRLKRDLQLLDNAKGGTIIVSDDGRILTVYKRN
jgi:hypothetical protein